MAVTETVVKGFAHCPEPRCPGSEQTTVGLVQTVVEERYLDRGGATGDPRDQLVENSHEYLRFAEETDMLCEHCGRTRECSLTERPKYNPLSGKDPMGLLGAKPFNPGLSFGPEDERLAEMQAQVDAMRAEMEKLREEKGP